MPDFTWLPANQAAREDVEAVFATGGAHKCRCQALKVPGWSKPPAAPCGGVWCGDDWATTHDRR
jgi:hypothetical protein